MMRRSLLGLTGLIVVVIAGLGILFSGHTPAATPSGSSQHTNIVSSGKGTPSTSGSGSYGYGY